MFYSWLMGTNPGRRAKQDPVLDGPGWMYRRIEPMPVEVKIDGRWWDGWLTEVVRDPFGENWGWGRCQRRPWNRWILRKDIRPRRLPRR